MNYVDARLDRQAFWWQASGGMTATVSVCFTYLLEVGYWPLVLGGLGFLVAWSTARRRLLAANHCHEEAYRLYFRLKANELVRWDADTPWKSSYLRDLLKRHWPDKFR